MAAGCSTSRSLRIVAPSLVMMTSPLAETICGRRGCKVWLAQSSSRLLRLSSDLQEAILIKCDACSLGRLEQVLLCYTHVCEFLDVKIQILRRRCVASLLLRHAR